MIRAARESGSCSFGKGCLELGILATLWQQRLYGLEVLRVLESNSELIVTEGTIDPLLTRPKNALTPAGRDRAPQMSTICEKFSLSYRALADSGKRGASISPQRGD